VSSDQSFRIYLLAVCFVSVVCVALTSGIALYSLLKVVAPELTLDTYSYTAHESLDNFKQSHFYPGRLNSKGIIIPGTGGMARSLAMRQSDRVTNGEMDADPAPLSNEELEEARRESYQRLIGNHRRTAVQELVRTTIIIIVSSILFLVHWRILRKHDRRV